MKRAYIPTTQDNAVSLAGAATITPSLAGALLTVSPQGLWMLLALLMVGAAALIVMLERRLPEGSLRIASRRTTTTPAPSHATLLKAE